MQLQYRFSEGGATVEEHSRILDRFFTDLSGALPKREEASLALEDLSLREVQLIDTVCRTVEQGGDNRSSAIAAAQQVTAGTLTSAVDVLVEKGYLTRHRDSRDRRVVRLLPTSRGRAASQRRRAFYRRITAHLTDVLSEQEFSALVRSMETLTELFRGDALAPSDLTPEQSM